jgi:hypothetical protein
LTIHRSVERDASLVDQPADVARAHAQPSGDAFDIEESLIVSFAPQHVRTPFVTRVSVRCIAPRSSRHLSSTDRFARTNAPDF